MKGVTIMSETYFCPVNGWDCPYWCQNGECALGCSAPEHCDDAALMEEELQEGEILIIGGGESDKIYYSI